jgi:3-methyl-2-oxobutanoate hydroxymethyltransferase
VKAGAEAVKIEGANYLAAIKRIIRAGIPVMGHLGFTPQSVNLLGYRIQGRERAAAIKLLKDARALAKAGCFAIVLEMIPETLAGKISRALKIPTIGIGAGKKVDGQVLVTQDLLGLYDRPPSFVKKYLDLNKLIRRAISKYIEELRSKRP